MKKFTLTLATATALLTGCGDTDKVGSKIELPKSTKQITQNFTQTDKNWKSKSGHWLIKNGVLKQTETKNSYNLILFKKEQFSNLDISVEFKSISGETDASGGIVFRAQDSNNYYIVRANALEGNYRLYTFKNGSRHQIATASVKPPKIGKFHTMRIVAVGEHIQAYLDGKLLLDHHDKSFQKGYAGLWTKADSVTEFDNFKVAGN